MIGRLLWLAALLPVCIDSLLGNLHSDGNFEFVAGFDPILDMFIREMIT
jgi:hypothetical protein